MDEPKSNIAALEDFIDEVFVDHELRAFIRRLANSDALVAGLPGPTASWGHVVSEAVALLRRHSRIDRDFFDALARERSKRRDDVDELETMWTVSASVSAGTPSSPWRALAPEPSFLRSEDRVSSGGLKIIGVHLDVSPEKQYPVLRFTLKNELAEHLTLLGLTVEVSLLDQVALLSRARPLEPADYWDVELPVEGGTIAWQSSAPIDLLPLAPAMIALRLSMRGGAGRFPPYFFGRYDLRFTFTTGEGASASSELIPCGGQSRRLRRPQNEPDA